MVQINLNAVGVSLDKPLFSNLSLSIPAGDRLGIVAANGRGKSTLLRAIAGQFDPTEGEISRGRGVKIGHVEQYVTAELQQLPFHRAVLDVLPVDQAENESWRVDITLDDLGVPDDMRERPLAQLSGGWQRLALLARAWVGEPDVLLLDEPTNHLDLAKIGLMERWLTALPRDVTVIIASHDRAFLDATTKRILFLRPQDSRLFALSYSRARLALEEADAAQERQFQRDIKEASQLRRQAAKLNNIGVNSGSDLLTVKTKQLKARAERLELAARPAHQERSAGAIKLANRGTHAKVLIAFEDTPVTTPDGTVLFRTGKQWIRQGDRVVLLGGNGAGKTMLIGMIRAAIESGQGSAIKPTPTLVPGYGDQNLADLDPADTPLALLTRRFELGEPRARSLLAGAGATIEMQGNPIARLSGGQRARLAMLVLRLTNPNFYLLDEPTNHLDIDGQEALEDELLEHDASCLLVSHDRSFVRAIGNRFWLIEKKKLVEVDRPEAWFEQMLGA
jgi:ATPase subunit of ABC transporter with duplicated ATPase domains